MSQVLASSLLGDVAGFLAFTLLGATALFMLIRSRLLKAVKNLSMIRTIHIGIAASAGIFIAIHVSTYFTYPVTVGVLLGYVSFVLAIVVWLTGTAFLEKVKDSLFFHGTLAVGLVSLVLVHAAATSVTIPQLYDEMLLGSALTVVALHSANLVRKAR